MPAGTLYVVATPLGNLGDLSPRAVATLKSVDTVAAEDTRRSQALLSAINAHPRLVSYHGHSTARREESLLAILESGRDVALVTDAGTPAISDPGADLVASAREKGITIVPVAGPSAVATALSASGVGADRYLFLGFLPRRGESRRRLLERAAGEEWAVVFFEAPTRLVQLFGDLIALCGADRPAVVTRELTKLHEEIRAGTLGDLNTYYEQHPPLGELTVILAGSGERNPDVEVDAVAVVAAIGERLQAGDSRKDIIRMVSARFGLSRNEAYRIVMEQG
jgi:16S rRNA (cytidine1402-2'-O)-methyltransferase